MNFYKSRFAWLVLCAAPLAYGADAKIDPNLYLNDVKFLASPELKGRATGSPELEKAAAFIAGKFREFGLKPVAGNTYLQPFPVTTDARLGKQNHFDFRDNGRVTTLRCPDDFVPFNYSSTAKLSAAVVFAGFGITAPEYHYDDYAGLDVKGKFVLVMRHEPQENDEHSIFAGKMLTPHAQFVNKAANAKMHGAAGLILIDDRAAHPNEPWEMQRFGSTAGPLDAGIAILQVREERIDAWFQEAGKSLPAVEAAIDKDLRPQSFAFPDTLRVDAAVDIARVVKTVHNVVAYVPGETGEYVIIGAHYDHLGMGGQYSLTPSVVAIHPGADDNASGTAGVIELARYVAHPELPLAKAVAMINMDMIGRIRDGKVYIGGVATGTGLRPMLEQVTPKYQLKVDYSEGPEAGSSDHTSFTSGQVPVLFFFSGLHADYHKPSDTWDKIDAPDAARLLTLVAEVADDLRAVAVRPEFVHVAPQTPPMGGASGSGYGPWFGSIPDFGEGVKGVKFADVREGSPAAKAGFKAGDVMIEFDGKKIDNLYDFTYALQAKKPGDEVVVKVLRDNQPVEAKVLLAKRQ
ncbi:MAG: M28 family peptidase [Bryobacteraceae bacterium]